MTRNPDDKQSGNNADKSNLPESVEIGMVDITALKAVKRAVSREPRIQYIRADIVEKRVREVQLKAFEAIEFLYTGGICPMSIVEFYDECKKAARSQPYDGQK